MSDQKMAAEIGARLRARSTLLWIVTQEGRRVRHAAAEIAAANRFVIRRQDCVAGITNLAGEPVGEDGEALPGKAAALPPTKVLQEIYAAHQAAKSRCVWILEDFTAFLGDPIVRRMLRTLAETLQSPKVVEQIVDGQRVQVACAQAIVITSPSAEVPPDLRDLAVVIRWALPDREELSRIFDGVIDTLPAKFRADAAPNGVREAAVEAAVGLSAEAAKASFQKSLVTQGRKIVPTVIADDKRRVISECKGLEWRDPDPRGLAAVGGLGKLKSNLAVWRKAFDAKARAYGLPVPKGILCVGPPGTGKSLICKAVSAAWQFPLIRFDLPAMKGGIVGQSEANIRQGLGIVEAVGRCILWADEIEKAIAPVGSLDGGVSADQLGTLLNWMQEREGGAFVVATANDVTRLPPELLRRFDAVFFVDLPSLKERIEIVQVSVGKFRDAAFVAKVDARRIADACDGFTGAEIARTVEAAMFAAFADGEREFTTADILRAAVGTVPIVKTAGPQIKALREWAEGKTIRASEPDAPAAPGGRIEVLDLGAE